MVPILQQYEKSASHGNVLQCLPQDKQEVASFLSLFCPYGMSQPSRKQIMGNIRTFFTYKSHVKKTLTTPTIGDGTRTHPLGPEASSAANFADFFSETFANGLIFSVEDLGDADGSETGADSIIRLLETGGGVRGETAGVGDIVVLISRLRCISKSPTYNKAKNARSNVRIVYTFP